VKQWRCGRGDSVSGEVRACARQHVVVGASGCPSGVAGRVGGLGVQAGTSSSAAALRRPLALMLRRASSLARATKARVGSSGAGREARGAQTVPGSNGQGSSPGGCQWRHGGFGAHAGESRHGFYSWARGSDGVSCAPRQVKSRYGWYGSTLCVREGSDVRQPDAQWRKAVCRPACEGEARGTVLWPLDRVNRPGAQ
jgi:hypothetical protein